MRTLIELYDSEPIYNFLAATVFRPDRVYFVGDADAVSEKCKLKTERFAELMGLKCEFVQEFAKSNDFEQNYNVIKKILKSEHDRGAQCAVDVTGGRDLALVAAGKLMEEGAEVIYYDSAINAYRLLSGGKIREVSEGIPCEAFITAAGGTIYEKTRNLSFSAEEWKIIKRVIKIFLENRESWTRLVKYLQRVSKKEGEKVADNLLVEAPISLSDGGKFYACNETVMRELERAGALKGIELTGDGGKIRFSYASERLAKLLVNEGVWLELSVYLTARETPCFFDAQTGVKFVWDIPNNKNNLDKMISENVPRNEVDVVLSRGITPVFISCKTRFPINDDLNELYAIKENFGGELACAIIATTKFVDALSPIGERAKAMGIGIIDERNFENGTVAHRLKELTDKNPEHGSRTRRNNRQRYF